MPQTVVGSVSDQDRRPCPGGAVHEGVRGQSVVSKAAPCSSVSDSVAVIRWEFIWAGGGFGESSTKCILSSSQLEIQVKS